MRIATWNVNSVRVRLVQLLEWLARAAPDIVCLQETKCEDARFPRAELEAAGYRCAFAGERAYNGVAILAREDPADIQEGIGGFADGQKRVLAASVAGARVVCVYCPNGQAVGSDKYRYKLAWYAALKDHLAAELARHRALVVAGDFNVAPEDRDVHDPAAWEGEIHCSAPERAAWRALLALGLEDAFRLFPQPEKSYTWWDYRAGALRRNAGLRIDHILLSAPLARRCTACSIDLAPRKLARPSDHAPVLADLAAA